MPGLCENDCLLVDSGEEGTELKVLPKQQIQESHAVAGKPRHAAVNSNRCRVCWQFAGAISAGFHDNAHYTRYLNVTDRWTDNFAVAIPLLAA